MEKIFLIICLIFASVNSDKLFDTYKSAIVAVDDGLTYIKDITTNTENSANTYNSSVYKSLNNYESNVDAITLQIEQSLSDVPAACAKKYNSSRTDLNEKAENNLKQCSSQVDQIYQKNDALVQKDVGTMQNLISKIQNLIIQSLLKLSEDGSYEETFEQKARSLIDLVYNQINDHGENEIQGMDELIIGQINKCYISVLTNVIQDVSLITSSIEACSNESN